MEDRKGYDKYTAANRALAESLIHFLKVEQKLSEKEIIRAAYSIDQALENGDGEALKLISGQAKELGLLFDRKEFAACVIDLATGKLDCVADGIIAKKPKEKLDEKAFSIAQIDQMDAILDKLDKEYGRNPLPDKVMQMSSEEILKVLSGEKANKLDPIFEELRSRDSFTAIAAPDLMALSCKEFGYLMVIRSRVKQQLKKFYV